MERFVYKHAQPVTVYGAPILPVLYPPSSPVGQMPGSPWFISEVEIEAALFDDWHPLASESLCLKSWGLGRGAGERGCQNGRWTQPSTRASALYCLGCSYQGYLSVLFGMFLPGLALCVVWVVHQMGTSGPEEHPRN